MIKGYARLLLAAMCEEPLLCGQKIQAFCPTVVPTQSGVHSWPHRFTEGQARSNRTIQVKSQTSAFHLYTKAPKNHIKRGKPVTVLVLHCEVGIQTHTGTFSLQLALG